MDAPNKFRCYIRTYEELNRFLSPEKRKATFEHSFKDGDTIKDILRDLSLPFSEVDLVLVDGEPRNLSYQPDTGNLLSVYPEFESFDISGLEYIHEKPLRRPTFILDVHLGKLARFMRMLGFDALYRNDYDDLTIIKVSNDELRTILTKDRGLLERKSVERGCLIKDKDPRKQLNEVMERFHLTNSIFPFSRCMVCNGLLSPVPKESIAGSLLPKTKKYYDNFQQCNSCKKIYWEGTHYKKMMVTVTALTSSLDQENNDLA